MKQHTLASAIGVTLALATANHTLAQVPPGPTSFPMVGITGAQTLQLNLVAYPPDPCGQVQLGFFRTATASPSAPRRPRPRSSRASRCLWR
jgi:hypothetical protein